MAEPGNENNNNTPWYQGVEGVDQEMIGHWQNKGWDTTDPTKLVVAVSKSQREAEKLIGARVDHDLLPVPRDPSKGDWAGVWTRLGKPGKPEEYEFTGVTHKDGTALDEPFVAAARNAAFKANVPKGAAVDFVKDIVSALDERTAGVTAETTAKLTEEKQHLARNWGTTPDLLMQSPHMQAAKQAAAALGVTGEAIDALEKVVGYAKTMDMFRNIASKIGEDKFITGDGKGLGNNGLLTREQAIARKAELKADSAWVTKFLANDQAARREMAGLDTIITGTK